MAFDTISLPLCKQTPCLWVNPQSSLTLLMSTNQTSFPLDWFEVCFFFHFISFQKKQLTEHCCPLMECTLWGDEWMLCIPVHCLTFPWLSLKSCITLVLIHLPSLVDETNVTRWKNWLLAATQIQDSRFKFSVPPFSWDPLGSFWTLMVNVVCGCKRVFSLSRELTFYLLIDDILLINNYL